MFGVKKISQEEYDGVVEQSKKKKQSESGLI